MSINKHIEQYLAYYIAEKVEETEEGQHAVLISGKWGIGKTHFIDNFIKKNSKDTIKLIKISLFGLKTLEDIDEQLFQAFHPILGHKYTKLATQLLKSTLKLGLKTNVFEQDTNITLDFSKLSIEHTNKGTQFVLIFDDLERSDISIGSLLGYINLLVESSGIKMILLANEEYLIKRQGKIYTEFKEKVIGRAFYLKQDTDYILTKILKKYKDIYLDIYFEEINDIYLTVGNDNLRLFKQTLDDFRFITRQLDEEYRQNNEFYATLIKQFFVLNMLYKKGEISEQSILNSLQDKDNSAEKVTRAKYFYNDLQLYSWKMWHEFVCQCDRTHFKSTTETLSIFIQPAESDISETPREVPLWLKLWHFRELEDSEFIALLQKLEKEFEDLSEDNSVIFLHTIALMIYFVKNSLCFTLDLVKITEIVNLHVAKYSNSEDWKNQMEYNDLYNGSGYSYFDVNDEDFQQLFKIVRDARQDAFNKGQSERKKNMLDKMKSSFSEVLKQSVEGFRTFLLEECRNTPILDEIDSDNFYEILININNKDIIEIIRIFDARYSENSFGIHGGHTYFDLKSELGFWQSFKKLLQSQYSNQEASITNIKQLPVKHNILKIFLTNNIEQYIKRLSK